MPNHNYHQLLFDKRFFKNFRVDGLFGVYLDTVLIYLGMGLVGIFIPLYVLKLTGNILNVFLMYAFYHLVATSFVFPAAFLIKKIGIDKTSFLGALTRATFLLFLILAKENILFLWPSFLFWGLTIPFCWLPYHFTTINIDGGDKKFGKEAGMIGFLTRLSSSLGPVLGGLIIGFLGFSWLYKIAILFTLLSGFALFLDKFKSKGMRIETNKVFKKMFGKKLTGIRRGLTGSAIETAVYGIAWPIFVFLALGSYKNLGIIISASLIVSLLIYYWAGWWVDKKGKGILKIGVAVNSLNLMIRPFLGSAVPIFLADSAYLTGSILIWTPFRAAFYEKGIGEDLDYIIIRELVIHFAGFLACLVLGALFYFGASWWLVFGFGALGLWMVGFIVRNNQINK